MAITPNSNLILYKGVALSADYTYTIWFSSASAQVAYFNTKMSHAYVNFTYIRNGGYISVPGKADDYYDVNYCSFANLSYGDKVFYAFVTDVVYINDDTTYLFIQLDIIQSWMFQMQFQKCFVEREHVSDDTIGKHTVPENLPFGDLVVQQSSEYKYAPKPVVKYAGSHYSATVINNVYDPLVTEDDPSAISSALDDLSETPERIAYVKMGCTPKDESITFPRNTTVFTFNGDSYTPVNKKLFTYPYCALYVDDYGTNSALLKWEDFANPASASFRFKADTRPYPFMTLIPKSYRGVAEASAYMVAKTDFPDCPYIIDNFRAWLSSNGAKQSLQYQALVEQNTIQDTAGLVNILTGALGSAVSVGASVATGIPQNPGDFGAGAAISNYLGKQSREVNRQVAKQSLSIDVSYAETHGTSIGGQFGGGNIPWFMGLIGWRFQAQGIKPEYARIIDDFFTRFGYKVNRYKIPNLKSRTRFNYVKTVGCVITGNIPQSVITGVEKIFDAGITLWHSTDVGNYSIRNEIRDE